MEVRGYRGSVDNGGAQIHDVPIPTVTSSMVPVWEDVEHGPGE